MANKTTKSGEKQADKWLFYFALVLLIIASVVFLLNISKITQLTGYAAGTLNLSINSQTQLNFTTDNINWNSGAVTSGATSATLNTAAGASNVTNGNWTGNTDGLVIENIGNTNVTLDLSAGKTAATLLSGTNPSYQWNITSAQGTSCTVGVGYALGAFNNTNGTFRACSKFFYADANDAVRIDIKLVIPSDSITGAVADTITATGTAV